MHAWEVGWPAARLMKTMSLRSHLLGHGPGKSSPIASTYWPGGNSALGWTRDSACDLFLVVVPPKYEADDVTTKAGDHTTLRLHVTKAASMFSLQL
mmetsp:Transcript_37848/g.121771  ORF Transcript_37848/g.121771 Transcript_37848/m.121771 type:complete len:96 (-) Transcript_37848:466-753(-)